MKRHVTTWKITIALFMLLSSLGLLCTIDASFAREKAEKKLAIYNDLFDQQQLASLDRQKLLAAELPAVGQAEEVIIPTPETLVAPSVDQNPVTVGNTTPKKTTAVVAPAQPKSVVVPAKTVAPAKPKATAVPVKPVVPAKPKPTRTKAS